MKLRLFATALLALLLIVAGGVASADASKSITGLQGVYGVSPGTPFEPDVPWFCLNWNVPTKMPVASNSFRVDWSLNKKGFRSYKQAVTKRAGSTFSEIDADGLGKSGMCWDMVKTQWGDVFLDWPEGQTLRVRIRARYSGKNGSWTHVSITKTADGFTSSDISLIHFDPPADEE